MDEFIFLTSTRAKELMVEAMSIALRFNLPTPPAAPLDADELLTPGETATLLKVSKVTIWDWGKKGILNPRRIGNQVRYLKSEVLAAAKPTKYSVIKVIV